MMTPTWYILVIISSYLIMLMTISVYHAASDKLFIE